MMRFLRVWAIVMSCAALAGAENRPPLKPLLTNRVDPREFGVQADTITVISAISFTPSDSSFHVAFSANFARVATPGPDVHYYADLDLPAGSVIDYIGLNTNSDTDAIFGVELYLRADNGGFLPLVGFSVPAHDWATDYSPPLGIAVGSHQSKELVLDVENAPSATDEFFGWVEVWWHRTVSPPPGSPTFNDVPTSDPGFQFIEALAASGITSGCGGGNYCPDNPLTRRQMAVFLSKALGLHWPL